MSPPLLADKLISQFQEILNMEELARDAPDELAVLSRLAEVYKRWAANRPHVMPLSDDGIQATMEGFRLRQATQQPP